VYAAYSADYAGLSAQANPVVFGQYIYQGVSHFASCSDWVSFQSQLQLPLSSLYFSSLKVKSYSFDFARVAIQNNNSFTCTNTTAISLIAASLSAGSTLSVACGGHRFKVFSCSGNVYFGVDCSSACSTASTCPSKGAMMLNPCQSCAQQTTASYFVVGLTYAQAVLYPIIVAPLSMTAKQRQMVVAVSVANHTGTLYCAALPANAAVTSSVAIQRASTVSAVTISSFGRVNVTIRNLVPVTTYDVYCFTQDFSSHTMPLASLISTKLTGTTLCCRSVIFSSLTAKLVEAAVVTGQSTVNVVRLESLPSSSVVLSLSLLPFMCSWQVNGTNSAAYALPATGNFTSSSTSASVNFVVLGSPGCYTLTASVSGPGRSGYVSANSSLIIRSSARAPDPPNLLSAVFSNDGLKLYLTLDTASDRGATMMSNYASIFACSQLVSFAGAKSSNCIWSSSTLITATISASSVSTSNLLVGVGSNVTLLANKIKSVCSFGLTCTYANASSVVATAPSSPIVPNIQLATATTIGGCDSIVMDPSTSTGSGGRSWKSLLWLVTGVGHRITISNTTAITTYLSSKYATTTSLVTIPQSMLSFGTYTVSLTLTNFLGQSGFQQVSVVVSDSNVVPRLTIVGSSTLSLYRSQTLSVFANASFPSCLTTSVSLMYTWSLFQGASLQYGVVSYARDPRFYRLATYSLAASTSYLLRVSVSASTSPGASLTSAQITVNVGVNGVSAAIAGGATQTFGAGSTLVLDASSSQDLDYPGGSLSYQWSCVETSPNFGIPCLNFSQVATSGSTLRALSTLLAESASETRLSVTVFVSNGAGYSSSASVTAVVLNVLIPTVAIQSSRTTFNVGDTVTFSALVHSTLAVQASWTALDSAVALGSISKNSKLSRAFNTLGYNGFDLAILPNSLVAGLSYTFQLSANYVGFNVSAYTKVTVAMNSPPSGGGVTVAPSNGTALSTLFFMVTTDWVDDASDYPFSYIFSYFTTKVDRSMVVKNLDSKSYASALLGQGLASNAYAVTCVATVMDAYNGSATALGTVTVLPILDPSALATQTSAILANALNSYDPSAVAQIIGATTSSVNAANCSVSVPCWSLHRENCSFTDLACGVCLTGYIGIAGDSNVACFSLENPPSAVSCTSADSSMCESGKCSGAGVCEEPDKTCKNNCTSAENGQCVFYDVNNFVTDSCSLSNAYCRAQCSCEEDFYGADCSMTEAELLSVQSVRDALCVGLYKTISIQDVSLDVILSRASSVSNILLDISELSDAGFGNCTAALIETINSDPDLAGSESTATLCMEALSSVLQKGSSLAPGLVTNITNTLTVLNNGIQLSMAVGQQSVALTTANVRMATSVQTASDVDSLSFSPPQTDYEKYLGKNTTSIALNTSLTAIESSSSVGVAVVQYASNPHGTATSSTSTALQLSSFLAVEPFGLRRRLDTSTLVKVFVQLENPAKVTYFTISPSSGTVNCRAAPVPYDIVVLCSVVNFSVPCNGSTDAIVNYECPRITKEATCDMWNGTSYSSCVDCTVLVVDSSFTSCLYSIKSFGFAEFSSLSTLRVGNFTVDYTIPSIGAESDVYVDTTIVPVAVTAAVISLIYISMILVPLGNNETDGASVKTVFDNKDKFECWLRSRIPRIFENAPLCTILWNDLRQKCLVCNVVSITASDGRLGVMCWYDSFVAVLQFMFFSTIFTLTASGGKSACGALHDPEVCNSLSPLIPTVKLCSWEAESHLCCFNKDPSISGFSVFVLVASVICVAVPAQTSLVQAVASGMCLIAQRATSTDRKRSYTFDNDESGIRQLQTLPGILLRGARLCLLQDLFDNTSAQLEARSIFGAYRLPLGESKRRDESHVTLAREVAVDVTAARQKGQEIVSSIHVANSCTQETLLLHHFIFSVLQQHGAAAANACFNLSDGLYGGYGAVAVAGAFVYLLGICAATIVLSLKMHRSLQFFWMEGWLISTLLYLLILQPAHTILTCLITVRILSSKIQLLVRSMVVSHRHILSRSKGLLDVKRNCLVQHMNPACRAARQLPWLPFSRLLLSLRDDDIPFELRLPTNLWFADLPGPVRDIIVGGIITGLLSLILVILAYVAMFSVIASAILAVIAVLCCIIVSLYCELLHRGQQSELGVFGDNSAEPPLGKLEEDEVPILEVIGECTASSMLKLEVEHSIESAGVAGSTAVELDLQDDEMRCFYSSDGDSEITQPVNSVGTSNLRALKLRSSKGEADVDTTSSMRIQDLYMTAGVESEQETFLNVMTPDQRDLQRSSSSKRWRRQKKAESTVNLSTVQFLSPCTPHDNTFSTRLIHTKSKVLLTLEEEFGHPLNSPPASAAPYIHRGSRRQTFSHADRVSETASPTFTAPISLINPTSIFYATHPVNFRMENSPQRLRSATPFALRDDYNYNEGRSLPSPKLRPNAPWTTHEDLSRSAPLISAPCDRYMPRSGKASLPRRDVFADLTRPKGEL
jgi:hypothetical protein